MSSDPCLSKWKQHQICLTYNYPEQCLETLINFTKCRKKNEKSETRLFDENGTKSNLSHGSEKKNN